MSADLLPYVEVPPVERARSAVIWLHGLGADGHDFEPVVPYLGLDEALGVRFIFPHAPKRAVTINMGLIMRAWYDIRGGDLLTDLDEKGMRESAGQIRTLIARENERGVPSRRIVLAGFSQGGVMALLAGLGHPEPLAGIVALSCYLVRHESLEEETPPENRAMSIFQAHGTDDPLIPLRYGLEACDRLRSLGCHVEWRTYPAGHEVHPEEIRDIGSWLGKNLARVVSDEAQGP